MAKLCPFGGKASYETERQAKRARMTLHKNRRLNAKGIRIYRCPNCYKYHFTHGGYKD